MFEWKVYVCVNPEAKRGHSRKWSAAGTYLPEMTPVMLSGVAPRASGRYAVEASLPPVHCRE